MMRRICQLILAILILALVPGYTDDVKSQDKKKLTYEQVFDSEGPRLFGSLPRIRGWLDDENYLEQRRDENANKMRLFKVNAQTGEATIFLDSESLQEVLPPEFSLMYATDMTSDYTSMVYSRKNDLYYLDTASKSFKRITANDAPENNPTFSPNGKLLAYTRNRDLFAYDLEKGLEYQLTSDGSDIVYNGWASWVYYEEILGRRSRYRAFYWSPDNKKLAFLRFDDTPVPEFSIFRADGTHGELETMHYPKPGDDNPMVKLGIVNIETLDIKWADFDETADQYIAWLFWTPDGQNLTAQWMNRDQNHIKIYKIDPASGMKSEIYSETQDSWVEFFDDLYLLNDNSGFIVRSTKDGFSHLYLYNLDGTLRKRLTNGEWSVRGIELVDEQKKQIFFAADKEASTENHLYRVNFDGKRFKKLTDKSGTHRLRVSPQGSYFIDTFSNISTPNQMAVFDREGRMVRELGDSRLAIMEEYDLAEVELFKIPIKDGYELPAKWYLPPDFNEDRKYPVIFSVYGGPGSRGVSNSYPFSLRNHYLAQEGIIVLTVDHRGSGHFGKAGVAQMHRSLGKWEIHDWVEAIKWLGKKSFIDPSRIGITGGSYGGYITLMALTIGADYFTHGISLYPVTDWRLYDTIYTERYMDRPQDNSGGYDYGSAMTHLDQFKGKLLLVHGTIDDNVHMQNSIQLVDELTKKEIQFDLMLYPNERHGVRNPNRRKHLSRLVFNFWQDHFINNKEPTKAVAISEN